MAAVSGGDALTIGFDLPLDLQVTDEADYQTILMNIITFVRDNIWYIEEQLKKEPVLTCVHIDDIFATDDQRLMLRFKVFSRDELHIFFMYTDRLSSELTDIIRNGIQKELQINLILDFDHYKEIEASFSGGNENIKQRVGTEEIHAETRKPLAENLIGIDERSKGEEPLITKTFRIHVPYPDKDIVDVRMRCDSLYHLDKKQMKRTRHGIYFLSHEVSVPREEIKYYYEVTLKGYIRKYKEESQTHEITDSTEQRDMWTNSGDKHTNGILSHATDIICAKQKANLKESVIEMEKLFDKAKVSDKDCQSILQNLMRVVEEKKSLCQPLLIPIVMGKIFLKIPEKIDYISKDQASYIISAIRNTQMEDFPSTSVTYMAPVCMCLTKTALGDKFSLLRHMRVMYPFFDEYTVNRWLLDCMTSKSSLCKDTLDSKENAKFVVLAILRDDAECHEISENVKILIGNIFKLLPFGIFCSTYQEVSNIVGTKISQWADQMFVRFVEELNFVKRDGIVNLLNLWDKVLHIAHTLDGMKGLMEKDIISTLKKGMFGEWDKLIPKLCQTEGLFDTAEAQSEILSVIASSSNQRINEQFKWVLEQEQFIGLPAETVKQVVEIWFKNLIITHLRKSSENKAFQLLYDSYFFAIQRAHLSDEDERVLESQIIAYLKSHGPQKVLQQFMSSESVCTTTTKLQTCLKHIRIVIEATRATVKAHDLIDSICVADKLWIDSRQRIETVYLLIDLFSPRFDEDNVGYFVQMVRDVRFWKKVFKASGKFEQQLQKSSLYIQGMRCINGLLEQLENHCLSFQQFLRIDSLKSEDVKGLLYCEKRDKHTVDKLLKDYKMIVMNTRQNVAIVHEVLNDLRYHVKKEFLEDIEAFILEVENINNNFDSMSPQEYIHHDGIWNEVDILVQPCKGLRDAIKSKVFWNINRHLDTSGEIVDNEYQGDETDCIQDIRYLFEVKSEVQCEPSVQRICEPCVQRICTYLERGSKRFGEAWRKLESSPSIPMKTVRDMFVGTKTKSKIESEIKIAEDYLRYKIPAKCKSTLERVTNIAESKRFVDAIELSVTALGLQLQDSDIFKDAIDSFHRLLEDKDLTLTFEEAASCLQIVFDIEERLKPSTVLILESVGKASSLLTFLKSIAEDDIRNLIDAVEDISEQHVDESTVSALIDVQRFFKPLLQQSYDPNIQSVFVVVQKQANLIGVAVDSLPLKIDDCMGNLHNLKSLYNNVANRGEQTKQVIKNILRKGKVHFQLCPGGKSCDFSVSYKQDKKHQPMTHAKSAVHDYRSRALLLMNTEKQKHDTAHSKHDLEKFISFVDICNEISSIIYKLHVCGHVEFRIYDRKVSLAQLEKIKSELSCTLMSYQAALSKSRTKFYLMNFFQGKHIQALDNFFERNLNVDIVKALIQFVHPLIRIEDLKVSYQNIKLEHNLLDKMQWIGLTFHQCFENLSRFKRPVALLQDQHTHIADIVQEGKMLFARLDEGSTQLVRYLMALFLKTTGALPEPNQVLLCSKDTTLDEIMLLLGRCLGAFEFYGEKTLFCITNIELLSSEVQARLIEELKCIHGGSHFCLAVICQCHPNHHLADEFSDYTVPVRSLSDETLREIFQKECPSVFTYTSDVAGLGKTSAIMKLAYKQKKRLKVLHISGPVHKRSIVDRFCKLQLNQNEFLHIEIGNVDNQLELDKILFEMIILRFIDADFTSVNMSSEYVAIEVGNTINDTLRNSLTTAVSFNREHLKWDDYEDFTISMEINSPVQVVCHYLKALKEGRLDHQDIYFTGEKQVVPLPASQCRLVLKTYFSTTRDSSFSTINACLNVLADQLKKMSVSAFFRTASISDMVDNKTLPTVRSTMVNALLDISKDFSSRSVSAYRSTQQQTVKEAQGSECDAKSNQTTDVDSSTATTNRVQAMIRWADSNHLIFVFHNQNIHTISPMYRDRVKVPIHITQLFEGQMKRQLPDLHTLDQAHLQDTLQKIARKQQPLPSEKLQKLAEEYALTPDNLLKMVLVMLRIKARIPIIIMGETGCGKTSLIRYLATMCDIPFYIVSIHAGIEEKVLIETIHENNDMALSNINSEVWVFFDEINTSESIGLLSEVVCHHRCVGRQLAPNLVFMAACNPYKLRSANAIFTSGLKSKVKTDELSRLVYRVHPLPEMLVDYVWDFGSLSEKDEKLYIERMVSGILKTVRNQTLLVELLGMSQTFTRTVSGTTSCVSLRDIQRCKILLNWFLNVGAKKTLKRDSLTYGDKEIVGIILALAHCYLSRYTSNKDRKEYRDKMHGFFSKYGLTDLNGDKIQNIISSEQKDILARMELPPGTAENVALQENVFVLLVCILTRIPIFLVGKPGCSKSLSMQVIKSNLRGKDSVDSFFKTLPQLYCVSFQGSESSTSDGIIKVFEKAENYQKVNKTDDVLSVVLLDEIGLAEVSRFNPLKVLHNLLEPNGLSRPNVAVVGISNWCLDESKMNRAVHLSRPEMDLHELYVTAISISESFESTELSIWDPAGTTYHFRAEDVADELKHVAASYVRYISEIHFENFHGLRDYYSLVKYFTRELSRLNEKPNADQIHEKVSIGVQRNFGGLPEEHETLLNAFEIQLCAHTPVLELINENMQDTIARHLMLITTGESITGILERQLGLSGRGEREILFGSKYEEDLTDDYNYRILSRIILCMEQGMVLILQDLDNIYGSLYDMLNKNYTEIGKKKLCRVALGAYSNPFCHVHDSFKCIVLVDKKQIQFSDPPFLNRFEKHYLQFSDVTNDHQKTIISLLERWIQELITVTDFCEDVCFPIYGHDMLASLVIKMDEGGTDEECELLERCKRELLWIVQPEVIVRSMKAQKEPAHQQFASYQDSYFELPLHSGLAKLMAYQLDEVKDNVFIQDGLMTIVFTNSNIHTKDIRDIANRSHIIHNIGAFKSEKQLSLNMQRFWLDSDEDILFLLCTAGHEKHVMLTKSVVERYRNDFLRKPHAKPKHVYFIIHVDRNACNSNISSAISFLSEWRLVTLDSLTCPAITVPEFCKMSLFDSLWHKRPIIGHLKDQLLWTFTRIKYPKFGRSVDSLTKLLEEMKNCDYFLAVLEDQIYGWIEKKHENINNFQWSVDVACNTKALAASTTFVDALEKYIVNIIDIPLSKFIFKMESTNILDCFFTDDHLMQQRRVVWVDLICKEDLIAINDLPDESGPETYVCGHCEIYLKMPFSMSIFRKIETTKEEFLHSVALLRGKLEMDEDDALPEDLLTLLFSQHESTILHTIPDLFAYVYDTDDYIHDYCNLVSLTACSRLDHDRRVRFMKLILQEKVDVSIEKPLQLFTRLHAFMWMNYHYVYSTLQLLEFCLSGIGLDQVTMTRVECKLLVANKEKENSTTKVKLCSEDHGEIHDTVEVNTAISVEGETQTGYQSNDVSMSYIDPGTKTEYQTVPVEIKAVESDLVTDEHDIPDCLRHKFVAVICDEMLPVEGTADTYGDLVKWQRRTHTVLTLCSNVSMSQEKRHALQFCYEISVKLISTPHQIDNVLFTELANLLRNETLDSPDILKCCLEMALSASTTVNISCLKMVSSILLKCLCREEPSSTAVNMLLSWIKNNTIPDNLIWIFYAPVRFMLKFECVEDPKMFHKILCKEPHNATSLLSIDPHISVLHQETVLYSPKSMSANGEESRCHEKMTQSGENSEVLHTDDNDNEESSEVEHGVADTAEVQEYYEEDYKQTDALGLIDGCLNQINRCNESSHFMTMVIDIIQEIYCDTTSDDCDGDGECDDTGLDSKSVLEFFLISVKLIHSAAGLQKAAAIAYVKYFLESVSLTLLKPNTHMATKLALKSILKPDAENETRTVLANFVMKLLGRGFPLSMFCQRKLELIQDVFGESDSIQSKKRSYLDGFEFFPLANFIPKNVTVIKDIFVVQEGHNLEDILRNFLTQNKTTFDGMLTIFSVALRHFYLVRPCHDLTDTDRSRADALYQEAETQMIEEPSLKLLKCISGKRDFGVDDLMIDERSEVLEYSISSWMTSFFSVLIASQTNQGPGFEMSILIKCLLKPLSVSTVYLPGFPDCQNKSEQIIKGVLCSGTRLTTCTCGYRLALYEENVNVCPVCQEDITAGSFELSKQTGYSPCPGYIRAPVSNTDIFRRITPASHHILCLMSKCCLLGSVAIGQSSWDDLAQVTSLDVVDVYAIIWKEIKEHWNMLSELLNVDTNILSLVMHCILLHTKDILCDNTSKLNCVEERDLWEEYFEQRVLNILICPYSAIREMIQKFYGEEPAEELYLRELETLKSTSEDTRTIQLSQLFQLRGRSNTLNFTQTMMIELSHYPFMSLVISNKEKLDLPKYMLPLIQWHITVISQANYLYKKQEFLKLSVEDFIRKCDKKDLHIRERFDSFMKTWNELRKRFSDFEIEPALDRVHFKTEISECVVLDKTSVVNRVLEILIKVQNDFIDACLQISKHSEVVGFMKRDDNTAIIPQVEVTEINKQHLVDFQIDLDDVIDQHSQCDLSYNTGRKMRYDIEGIEKEVAVSILVGKVYIGFKGSLPFLGFTDELYRNYVSLVNDIKESVSQGNVPNSVLLSVKANHKNDTKMATELLTYLGMVMTWLKKTKGNPEMPLVDYIDKWQGIFTDSFPKHLLPSPLNSLLLCHVIAFHEVLEELSAESILESLPDEFMLELESNWEISLKNLVKNERMAAVMFQKALKRFTYRCLSLLDSEPDISVLYHLQESSFWPDDAITADGVQGKDGVIPMEQVLPHGLTVGHVYWTIRTIDDEFEVISERDMKISKIASSYKSQNTSAKDSKDSRKKKLLKGFKKRS